MNVTDWPALEELDNELERVSAKLGRQVAYVKSHPQRQDEYRVHIARLKDSIELNRALYRAIRKDR